MEIKIIIIILNSLTSIATLGTAVHVMVKVKFAYEPSGPAGHQGRA